VLAQNKALLWPFKDSDEVQAGDTSQNAAPPLPPHQVVLRILQHVPGSAKNLVPFWGEG